MANQKTAKMISMVVGILVAVGAINWGLVSLFNFNLVQTIFGIGQLSKWLYGAIGVSGVYALYQIFTKRQN